MSCFPALQEAKTPEETGSAEVPSPVARSVTVPQSAVNTGPRRTGGQATQGEDWIETIHYRLHTDTSIAIHIRLSVLFSLASNPSACLCHGLGLSQQARWFQLLSMSWIGLVTTGQLIPTSFYVMDWACHNRLADSNFFLCHGLGLSQQASWFQLLSMSWIGLVTTGQMIPTSFYVMDWACHNSLLSWIRPAMSWIGLVTTVY